MSSNTLTKALRDLTPTYGRPSRLKLACGVLSYSLSIYPSMDAEWLRQRYLEFVKAFPEIGFCVGRVRLARRVVPD